MNGGHTAALDLEVWGEGMQQQAQGRGGGRARGYHAITAVDLFSIDTGNHDTVDMVRRQRTQQHARRTVAEVGLHIVLCTELPGGVDHDVDPEDVPGHFPRRVDAHDPGALVGRDEKVAVERVALARSVQLGAEKSARSPPASLMLTSSQLWR